MVSSPNRDLAAAPERSLDEGWSDMIALCEFVTEKLPTIGDPGVFGLTPRRTSEDPAWEEAPGVIG